MGGHSDELRRKDKVWQTMTKEQRGKEQRSKGPIWRQPKGEPTKETGVDKRLGWAGGVAPWIKCLPYET